MNANDWPRIWTDGGWNWRQIDWINPTSQVDDHCNHKPNQNDPANDLSRSGRRVGCQVLYCYHQHKRRNYEEQNEFIHVRTAHLRSVFVLRKQRVVQVGHEIVGHSISIVLHFLIILFFFDSSMPWSIYLACIIIVLIGLIGLVQLFRLRFCVG